MGNKYNCGIYWIRNKINNKKYVGSSSNLKKRRYNHYYHLRSGSHPNQYLQNAWDKDGEGNFEFEELLYCDFEFLCYFENLLQSGFKSFVSIYGYNIIRPEGEEGFKHSEKTKEKISISQRGERNHMFGKKLSEETKKKIGESSWGRKHTEETKRKIGMASKGTKHTAATKKKISEANRGRKVFFSDEHRRKLSIASKGRKLSEETKQKISVKAMGREMSQQVKNKIALTQGGNIFVAKKGDVIIGIWISKKGCSKELGCDRRAMSRCLNNRQKIHKGYAFKYI